MERVPLSIDLLGILATLQSQVNVAREPNLLADSQEGQFCDHPALYGKAEKSVARLLLNRG